MKINLLKSLPKTSRNVKKRKLSKNTSIIKEAKKFGKLYFDGPREYGYGGYFYDGRWKKVAEDIVSYYNLKSKSKILDVGCGKGFLVKDLCDIDMDAYGIDISEYAIKNSPEDIKNRLKIGSAEVLPYKNNYFDLVISINTLHNLKREDCKTAIREIVRVTKKNSFIQVDSYNTPKEKEIFEDWVLTAVFHCYPQEWIDLFKEVNYKGDYYWTIV